MDVVLNITARVIGVIGLLSLFALPFVLILVYRRWMGVGNEVADRDHGDRPATRFTREQVEVARILGKIADVPLTYVQVWENSEPPEPGAMPEDGVARGRLRDQLEHREKFWEAADQLVGLGPGALPILVEILHDKSGFAAPQALITVILACHRMGPSAESAIPAITQLLDYKGHRAVINIVSLCLKPMTASELIDKAKVDVACILCSITNWPLTYTFVKAPDANPFDDMIPVLKHEARFADAARKLVRVGPKAIPYLVELQRSVIPDQWLITISWARELMPASAQSAIPVVKRDFYFQAVNGDVLSEQDKKIRMGRIRDL